MMDAVDIISRNGGRGGSGIGSRFKVCVFRSFVDVQCFAVHCSALQCIAVYCSVLQCSAAD